MRDVDLGEANMGATAATDDVPGLGRVEQLVLRGDGLTTTSLEILTGEVITTRVLRHWRIGPGEDAWATADEPAGYAGLAGEGDATDLDHVRRVLEITAEDVVLARELLLEGPAGSVHATARLMATSAALPPTVGEALATSDEPIGRLLRDHGMPVTKQLIDWGTRAAQQWASYLGVPASERVPVRTYAMRGGLATSPLAVITEWFSPRVFAPAHPRFPRARGRR